jgi:hypothetical protein
VTVCSGRLFARGDVDEVRKRAPIALTRDAGEPLVDIPDNWTVAVVVVAVEWLDEGLVKTGTVQGVRNAILMAWS